MNLILIAVISLGAIGLIAAVILYGASKKFAVYEDPRIAQVNEVLPQANCGGCGYPGCGGFADACVKASSLDGLLCPAGGQAVMDKVADILGLAAGTAEPMVAVVRCKGSCEHRPRTNIYDGATSCAIASALYTGETGCAYGCLGCGDCVEACLFDAIHMNPETGLPEVIEDRCTACAACVKACPRNIIEIRNQGKKSRRVYVSCVNKDKGAYTRKICSVGCIGCGKCVKTCPFEAISLANNLAYIDYNKCKLCRKCVDVCPQNTIDEVNFPPKKKVEAKAETVEVKKEEKVAAAKAATKINEGTAKEVVINDNLVASSNNEEVKSPKVLTEKAKEQIQEALDDANPIATPGERMRVEEDMKILNSEDDKA